jgi:preprotein translocase subunit YajC
MPLLVLLLFFVVMYVLMIRPQQRRAREHQALVAAVQVGDEIMTTAGIFGTVTALDDAAVSLEVSPGVVIRVARAAIGQRVGPEPLEMDELTETEPEPEPETETETEPPAPEPPTPEPPGRDSPWGDWGQAGPQGN